MDQNQQRADKLLTMKHLLLPITQMQRMFMQTQIGPESQNIENLYLALEYFLQEQ